MKYRIQDLVNILDKKEHMINDFKIEDKVETKLGEKATILDINKLGFYIDLSGKVSNCVLIEIDDTNEQLYISPEDLTLI